jgi:hypothetical protein
MCFINNKKGLLFFTTFGFYETLFLKINALFLIAFLSLENTSLQTLQSPSVFFRIYIYYANYLYIKLLLTKKNSIYIKY